MIQELIEKYEELLKIIDDKYMSLDHFNSKNFTLLSSLQTKIICYQVFITDLKELNNE